MGRNLGVTIVICCHNSESVIQKTLGFVDRQKVSSKRDWEVLIIDNGSTDETLARVKEASQVSKNLKNRLRIVEEKKLGISKARLRALSEAKHDVLSFVDDDNLVCDDWVEVIAKIMEDNPKVAVCGSRNLEPEIINKPSWFDEYKHCYAIGKQARKSGDVTEERGFVWGAGMSVRKKAWEEIISKGYKFILTGRVGKMRSAGEDSELCFGLRLGGWRMWYQDDLTLVHSISSSRLNWLELRKMYRGFGVGRAGHNPYFFAEKAARFSQHWYIQTLIVLWDLLKNHSHIFFMIMNSNQVSDNTLRIEHKIGQVLFYLTKRSYFDAYTDLLRRNFRGPEIRVREV